MTISLRAAGTATGATAAVTAVNPAVPAGATTGDLSVLTVWVKPYNAMITTPTGWTKVGEHTNGTTVAGTDTGSTKVAVYVLEDAAPGAIGNIGQTSANSMGAVVNTYARDEGAWNYAAFTQGFDATNAANHSATGDAGIGVAAGDWVLQSTAVNGDLGTPSAMAVGGMFGATLGAYVNRQSAAVTTGTDSRGIVGDIPVTAGSSTAAPTFTYTNASAGSGTTIWLRLRLDVAAWSGWHVVASEPVGMLDAPARALDAVREPTELAGLSDAITVQFTGGGTLGDWSSTVVAASENDTLGLSDAVTASLVTPTLGEWSGVLVAAGTADTLGLVDLPDVTTDNGETSTDVVGLSDAVTAQMSTSLTGSAADVLGVSDAAAVSVTAAREIADTAGITDAVTVAVTGAGSAAAADTLGATDAATATLSASRNVGDALGATDAVSAAAAAGRAVGEQIGATDTVASTATAARAVADTAGLSDAITVTFEAAGQQTIGDTAGLADTATAVVDRPRAGGDVAGLTDVVAASTSVERAAGDTAGLTDALSTPEIGVGRSSTETAGIGDAVAPSTTRGREVVDVAGLADVVASARAADRAAADAAGMADAITVEMHRVVTVTDLLALIDDVDDSAPTAFPRRLRLTGTLTGTLTLSAHVVEQPLTLTGTLPALTLTEA